MTINKTIFGRNLTALKDKSGKTWVEIGRDLGYDQPRYLFALASGKFEPRLETVRRMATYFDVSVAALVEDNGAVPDEEGRNR